MEIRNNKKPAASIPDSSSVEQGKETAAKQSAKLTAHGRHPPNTAGGTMESHLWLTQAPASS